MQSRGIETYFEVTSHQLRDMDPRRAVRLFRELLWAEAYRLRIPLHKVHVSDAVNVADGGIDARVDEHEAELPGNVILSGQTRYQIKTGSSFEPWQESAIRRELFGSKDVSRGNLAEGVSRCLEQGGNYALVCFGRDIVDKQHETACSHLRTLLVKCGFENPSSHVWGTSHVVGFLKPYPSLCLEVTGRGEPGLRTWISWSSDGDMKSTYRPGPEQEKCVEEIRSVLRGKLHLHIRVCGEPGCGKTKMVLEATAPEDLSPLVVYWESGIKFSESRQFNELRHDSGETSTIIVADECDPDTAARIWNGLKNRLGRVRLVSIDHEFRRSASPDYVYIESPALPREQSVSILVKDYNVPRELAARYSELCIGSPRATHIVGINLNADPSSAPSLFMPPSSMGDVWERHINGRDARGSEPARQRRAVLTHLALFKMFGLSGPVREEATVIARLVQETESAITLPRFNAIVSDLRGRKLLQGVTTLYITPKLFHVWLWSEWWNSFGVGIEVQVLLARLTPNLFDWFGEMFRYAEESEAAKRQVQELLGPDGPFSSPDFLNTERGARFFLSLAEANPGASLRCLERTIGRLDREQLLAFQDGRRSVINSLEKIAFFPDLFHRAAQLLLALADAENETWGNNATGVFAGLFTHAEGEVAPTATPPEQRFPTLEETLNSPTSERRSIGLKACAAALIPGHGMYFVRSDLEQLGSRVRPWVPSGPREMIDSFLRVWELLDSKRRTLPTEEERTEAARILVDKGGSLLDVPDVSPKVLETWWDIQRSQSRLRKTLTATVLKLLRFRAEHLHPETLKHLRGLHDHLSGADYSTSLRRYVGLIDWYTSLDPEKQRGETEERITELARQAVEDPELFRTELRWLLSNEAENSFVFGRRLASQDPGLSFLEVIFGACRLASERPHLGLLGGYLRQVFESDAVAWESILERISADDTLVSYVPELTWRSGSSEQAARRITVLCRTRGVPALELRYWCFGTDIWALPEPIVLEWLGILMEDEDASTQNVPLELMHRYYCDESGRPVPPRGLTKSLLLSRSVLDGLSQGSMAEFYWANAAQRFLEAYSEEAIALLNGVLASWGSAGRWLPHFEHEGRKVLDSIVRSHPEAAWQCITDLIGELNSVRTFLIMNWLQGSRNIFHTPDASLFEVIPLDRIWSWIESDPTTRARFLALHVPKTLTGELGRVTRELLIRYGDDEEVRRSLSSNFFSEGFSGSASDHYLAKKRRFQELRAELPDPKIRRWIDEYIESLDHSIETFRVQKEREGL
jgi:hypothetical protein